MARVIVVGSINQDITVTVDRFPSPGETLSGSSLTYGLGGKGANQAAAAAHSGAETLFVGAVGTDLSGQRLRADLAAHGVDVTHVRDVDGPTGTALITVAASGENTIILDAGANRAVTIEPAKASLFPAPSDIVVLQAEVPSHTNTEVLAWAHSFGARVLLNLAPARDTDPAAMSHIDILVVNETEAGLTLGLPAPATPTEAIGVARALRGMGPRHVVVTLGAQGGRRGRRVPRWVTVPLSTSARPWTPRARATRAWVRWRQPWRSASPSSRPWRTACGREPRRSCRRELRPPTVRCRRSRATERRRIAPGVNGAAWASARP